MDADSFFGFDTSLQPEDDDDDGGILEYEDDEYDALNDETFGSAAIDGDWEENHKQLSSLTEAERLQRSIKEDLKHDDLNYKFRQLNTTAEDGIQKALNNFTLDNDLENLSLFSRNNDTIGLPGSPGNSIWSLTPGVDTVRPQNINSINRHNNFGNNLDSYKLGSSLPNSLSGLPKNIHNIKTVEELEQELKRRHSQDHSPIKLSAITVEDLEKDLIKSRHELQQRIHPNLATRPQFMVNPTPTHMGHPNQRPLLPQSGNLQILRPFGNLINARNEAHVHHLLKNSVHNFPNGFPGLNNQALLLERFPQQILNQRQSSIVGRMPDNRGFNQDIHRNYNNFPRNNGHDRRMHEQNHRFEQQRNQREYHQNHSEGNRVRRDSDAEWEEWMRIRQNDPYAGLMTPRERNWLRNMQATLLQTDNPYQNDYYYVMQSVKQQKKREEEVIEIDGLQLLLPDKGKDGMKYEPPRLENSLGKLQVASVNAPRKIIDLEVIHLDSSHPATSLQRDMRKHRHLLLHIEKLYNIQIELDDLERKIRALPDCPTRDSFRSQCFQLVNKLWNGLINPHESFVQILCIKKGKTLAARLLSWVGESEVEHLLATVIQNLSSLTKKDLVDKRLPLFWPVADRYFASANASSLVNFGIMLTPQLKPQKNQFIPAIDSKLGFSIIMAMLVRAEILGSTLDDDPPWSQFIKDVMETLGLVSDRDRLQLLPSINLAVSSKHLSSQISKCKDVNSDSVKQAVDLLKNVEAHLIKNTPNISGPNPFKLNSQKPGNPTTNINFNTSV